MPDNNIKCRKCNCLLEEQDTVFDYLGNTFTHKLPRCPKCGRVYIPQELVKGKMAEVELMLEDK